MSNGKDDKMKHSHDHDHSHHHLANHHHHNHDLDGKALYYSILINVIITVSQAIGGIMSGSLALLSDATHNLSDVLALIFSFIAKRLSQKESTVHYTFGLKRAEIISALVNGVILICVGIGLFYEAVRRLLEPQMISGDIVIVLAIVGIIGNGLSVLILAKGSQHSMNMKSAYLHMLTDMLTSICVLVGGIAIRFFNTPYIDSILTILIACYLCYSSYFLIIDSLKILMQFAPQQIDLSKLLAELCAIPSIKNIHHVHLWQLSDNDIYFEAHFEINEDMTLSQIMTIRERINAKCSNKPYNINHITSQFEYKPHCSIQPIENH